MKRYHYFLTLLISFWFSSQAFTQASTTVQTTIAAQDIKGVAFNLDAKKFEIKETKGSRIMIEIKITVGTPNEHLLKYLVEGGRYELVQEINPSTQVLKLSRKPNMNVLLIKGKECTEDLEFVVYLPSNVKFASGIEETALNK